MSEQESILIGTPANVTVFIVDYKYTKPPRQQKLPRSARAKDDSVENRTFIISSDPSGRDVFDIVQRLVLGPNPYEGSDFRVITQQRMLDAMGLAQVTSGEKLDGKAPVLGVPVEPEDDSDPEDGEGEGEPPVSNLN